MFILVQWFEKIVDGLREAAGARAAQDHHLPVLSVGDRDWRHAMPAMHVAARRTASGVNGGVMKNVTVCLSFDFDAISLWLGGFRARSLSAISRGEFGRVGATRLLAMLREWGIRSTWFVPGHSAETFPEIARRDRGGGHEIGNHGYFHAHPKSAEDEEQILIRGNQALMRLTGQTARRLSLTGRRVELQHGRPAAQARLPLRLEPDGRRLHSALHAARRSGARRTARTSSASRSRWSRFHSPGASTIFPLSNT